MAWDRKSPFLNGDLQHYPEEGWYLEGEEKIEWRPEIVFIATLSYAGFARGRSAAYMKFTSSGGNSYPMFLKEFDAIVHLLKDGKVKGKWAPIKRGQNFGIKLVVAL